MFKIITKKKYKALLSEIEKLKELPNKYQRFEPENRKIIVLRAEREFREREILSRFEMERIRNILFYELLAKIKKEKLYKSTGVGQLRSAGYPNKIEVEICVVTPKDFKNEKY